MRRNQWITGLVVLALAGPVAAHDHVAQQGQQPDDQATERQQGQEGADQEARTTQQVSGEIVQIDQQARTVTIDSPERAEEMELEVADDATVFHEGRIGEFEQLEEGQQVRASFSEQAGENQARWIEVVPEEVQQQPGTDQPGTEQPGTEQPGTEQPGTQQPGTEPEEEGWDTGGGGDVMAQAGTEEEYGEPDPATPGEGPQTGDDPLAGLEDEEPARAVVGTLQSIDVEQNEVVLEHAGQQWTLRVPEDASVRVEGEEVTLEQLEEGQQVLAALDAEGEEILHLEVLEDADPFEEPGEDPDLGMPEEDEL